MGGSAAPVGCVNSDQPHRSQGVAGKSSVPNPAARLRRELPTRRARRRSALLITGAQRPARAVGCQHSRSACKSSISLVANRVLTAHKVLIRGVCPSRRRWSRCRDGQPLSFLASSVWGASTRFRLQIGMITRCEQSFDTPHGPGAHIRTGRCGYTRQDRAMDDSHTHAPDAH